MFLNEFRTQGGCELTRGTRGKAHLQPAFEVAHLAAGGSFWGLNSYDYHIINSGIMDCQIKRGRMDPVKEREIKQAVARSGRGFFLTMGLGVVLVLLPLLFTGWPAWVILPVAFILGPLVGALLYLPLQMSKDMAKGFWFSFFKRK